MGFEPVRTYEIIRHGRRSTEAVQDLIAVEEPLEIRVEHGPPEARRRSTLAVTMRTPGRDLELALGWLLAEGVVTGPEDVLQLHHCAGDPRGNAVRAVLAPAARMPERLTKRRAPSYSGCGVCGSGAIEELSGRGMPAGPSPRRIPASLLLAIPDRLHEAQTCFRYTGGMHGAALLDEEGTILLLREDVGRHNALDKILGAMALQPHLGSRGAMMVMSSRASYELAQKAAVARVPILACIGAASSLAVDAAEALGLTLVGFLRQEGFNVYCGSERIVADRGTRGRPAPERPMESKEEAL